MEARNDRSHGPEQDDLWEWRYSLRSAVRHLRIAAIVTWRRRGYTPVYSLTRDNWTRRAALHRFVRSSEYHQPRWLTFPLSNHTACLPRHGHFHSAKNCQTVATVMLMNSACW